VLNVAFRGVVEMTPYEDSMVSGVYVHREKESIMYPLLGWCGEEDYVGRLGGLVMTDYTSVTIHDLASQSD
jgi:hypothetical protein